MNRFATPSEFPYSQLDKPSSPFALTSVQEALCHDANLHRNRSKNSVKRPPNGEESLAARLSAMPGRGSTLISRPWSRWPKRLLGDSSKGPLGLGWEAKRNC